MTTQEVKNLQDELVRKGYMTQADVNTGYGIYGPRTTAAVKRLQDDLVNQGLMTQAQVNTGYGTFGPKTTAAVQQQNLQQTGITQPTYTPSTAIYTAPTITTSTISPEDQYHNAINQYYNSNPQAPVKYSSVDDMLKGITGDQMTNMYGKPFSSEEQAAAYTQAEQALNPYYQAEQQKATADTQAQLAAQQQAYADYLKQAQQDFMAEKTRQDQAAAEQGVLFSGGRAQKLQNLKSQFEQEQATKLAQLGSNVGDIARGYQYQYGNAPAQNLSQYYTAGTNVYNPNVARGGATTGGLSSVYNPSAYNFQGTQVNAAKAAKQQRAAGLLWNQANKLTGGLSNAYK